MNKVVVAVPIYNEEAYLRKSLDSLIENYDSIDRIVLSDNASTDSSGDICKEYADKYEKVVYVRQEKQLPTFAHLKLIVGKEECEYFMFFRVKNIIPKGFIRSCVDELDSHQDVVVVTPSLVYYYPETNKEKGYEFEASKDRYPRIDSSDRWMRVNQFIGYLTGMALWSFCLYLPLKRSFYKLDEENPSSDEVLGMYMSIEGSWKLLCGHPMRYFCRRETLDERIERYRNTHMWTHPRKNTFSHVMYRLWAICRTYFPEKSDENFRNKFTALCQCIHNADWTDEEWDARHDPLKQIDFINRLSAGKKLVIFGTGDDSVLFNKKFSQHLQISFFIDNFYTKNEFLGRPVFRPNDIKDQSDCVVCIVSRRYELEMLKQMISLGYDCMKNIICTSGMLNSL